MKGEGLPTSLLGTVLSMIRSGVIDRSWMVNRGMVGWCRRMVGGCLSIVRLSFISDISHISTIVVSMIGHMLCSTIREQHRVGTLQ